MTDSAEIHTFSTPWPTSCLDWCRSGGNPFRLGVSSFVRDYTNQFAVYEHNANTGAFSTVGVADHPYPVSRLRFSPDPTSSLIASTGDYLRLWSCPLSSPSGINLTAKLNNNKSSEFCAPLTSFDWNEASPELIGVASVDTTCTIWDINAGVAKTQLIAHDREVYDIAFARGSDVFASVGADGSVRMFDLRALEHSTIIYEQPDVPLVRIVWNKLDPNYLAAVPYNASKAIILDVRVPSSPVAELTGHTGPLNGAVWAPHSSAHIATAGEDSQVLIWDMSNLPKPIDEAALAYDATSPVNSLTWSASQTDWVGICFDDKVQLLRV